MSETQRVGAQGANALPTSPVGQTQAEQLIADATHRQNHRGGRAPTVTLNTEPLAEAVLHAERTDPTAARDLENALVSRMDAGQMGRFYSAMRTERSLEAASLTALGAGIEPGTVTQVSQARADQLADGLIEGATRHHSGGRGGRPSTSIDVNELAFDLSQMAEANPADALAAKLSLDGKLTASQVSELNRLTGGGDTWQENVALGFKHPIQGAIGFLKGTANGISDLGEMLVQGQMHQAAGRQYEAAGMAALFGNGEAAERHIDAAQDMHRAANDVDLPTFDMNRAERGGAIIGTTIELAAAGYGVVKVGAKLLTKVDDAAGVGRVLVRQMDEGHNAARFARLGDNLSTAERANDVVQSLRTTGQLPSNYMDKATAATHGWSPGKSVEHFLPAGSNARIGGDVYQNSTKLLPDAPGRVWTEADISNLASGKRGGERLLYSNDGLTFVTNDHYESFYQLPNWQN